MVGQKPAPLKFEKRVRQQWKLRQSILLASLGFMLFLLALLLLAPRISFGGSAAAVVQCVNVEDTLRSALRGSRDKLGWMAGALDKNPFAALDELDAGVASGELVRPKVLGVVGIQTGFASQERRRSIRETWMPSTKEGIARLEESTGLAFRFVIGYSRDSGQTAALDREIAHYSDFIRVDIEEDYHRLKYKTLAFFKAAFLLFDADFYVKADDDIYLRPDRLSTLLAAERPSPRTYLGCMKKGPVISDSRMKWYEPLGYMLGPEYFLHAYGPIYALSKEVVADLAAARNDSFRYFSNEDVTVGAWMLAMNVDHEDNRALCDPACHANSIAVWDIPRCSGLCNSVERMAELHKLNMCSKSPTLPD